MLCATGRFGGVGQLALLAERVDAGGFAGIGAAHEGHLRKIVLRQLIQFSRGGEKARGVQPSQGGFTLSARARDSLARL